jgi:hypothetical protein
MAASAEHVKRRARRETAGRILRIFFTTFSPFFPGKYPGGMSFNYSVFIEILAYFFPAGKGKITYNILL